ncbi:hypothetical protein LZG37_24690, partial [Halomonas titanicae]|uniref:hypothetical protein n=3 Tax=Vreelandella titanicae TaxID=664683 RepID=UPI001F4727BE
PLSADGSVGSPHARVGHRQALISQKTQPTGWVFCLRERKKQGISPWRVPERRPADGRPEHRQALIMKNPPGLMPWGIFLREGEVVRGKQ